MKFRYRRYIGIYLPALVSFLIMAAHLSRNGLDLIAILWLFFPVILFTRRKFNLWFCQLALFLGSAEWIRSALKYIDARIAMGEDWTRLAIILFSVAAFTLISGLLLFARPIRERYH